ncbi:MAG: helix-turn-helix domain-containing protein, partial [Lachnospiraceae bacterium]
MGIKQQEKTVQTKQEMKKAAKELFLQKGYDATSIQDIADKAAYSVGSYYRQWKSKQQIFMEIW